MLLNVEETGTNGHTGVHITEAAVVFGFAKEEQGNLLCLPVLAGQEVPAILPVSVYIAYLYICIEVSVSTPQALAPCIEILNLKPCQQDRTEQCRQSWSILTPQLVSSEHVSGAGMSQLRLH